MILLIIFMIIGFLLLVLGADLLVRGSSNIAQRFHIPEMLIGLTIVSVGTSMPELMITISSAQKGSTDLILGNAIGSNIFNLLLILGITATLRPVVIDKDTKRVHLPVALLSSLVILFVGFRVFKDSNTAITSKEGMILVILYGIYFLYPILIELKDIIVSMRDEKKKHTKPQISILLSFIYIIIGVVLLKYGGDLVVDEATEIANIYGISERIIGLTVVAIGTALPELITSIIASIKAEQDLAVGNLLGSCIINSFLILGTGAMITPLPFSIENVYDLVILSDVIGLIMLFNFIGKKNTITRYKAGMLLVLYVFYMMYILK